MELLARCRDLALPFYGELLKSAQQTLRERLFEQAEKSGNNEDQRVFFEAIQRLNESAAAINSAFAAQLEYGYQQFLAGRDDDDSPPPIRGTGNLTLVAREQLEDQLAITTIVSRANSQYAEALWKLNRRLAVLRGGRKVADDSNPFGPAKVGLALRQGMAQLDVELKARLFIYKHLGKLLLAAFGKSFAQLNAALAEAGVLPNLKFIINKDADELPPEPEPAIPEEDPAISAASGAEQRRLYSAIMEELRQRSRSGGPRVQAASGISYAGLEAARDGAPEAFLPMDYALVLSALQQSPEFASAVALQKPLPIDKIEQRLFLKLKQQAKPEARHKLGERDADTVDVVGLVFRYMLDDPKIPDLVKSLLSHLHTPYLKLALLDPTFLDDQKHPARVLINRMAETGTRWINDEKERVVLPKLKSIVETVLRGFVDDVGLFERLLDDFNRFREGMDKRAQMVEKRNRAAQEGIERLTVAKQRAAAEIGERIKGYAIPDSIKQLLQKPWTDFLAFNYLRNGENSLSWKAALKVVDGVLWSVQGESKRTRDEFQRYQQQLEQAIAEGLRTIGYDSDAGQEMLVALREAQDLAYSGKPAVRAPLPAQPAPAPVPEVAATAAPSPEEEAFAEHLRSKVEFGTWFEFDRPGQKPQQLKLAWFSRVSEHYMFVNQSGVKQAVEALPDLVRGLCDGTIRLLQPERKSFMERAFSAILNTLRGREV